MIFKSEYKCLDQNIFSVGEYKIIPLRFEDRSDIMNWRNEQMHHLRQEIKLTRNIQDSYFKNEVFPLFSEKRPKQLLFSYLSEGKLIGYGGLVHINWIERTAEVSFIMETSRERDEFDLHWSTYLYLLKKLAFIELKFRSLHTYSYNLRPFLYPTLKKNNFYLKERLKHEVDGRKRDVFIHECVNEFLLLEIREANESDAKLIFNWSNDPLVRAQSFQPNIIEFENHKNWFNKKLQSDNSLLLISEVDEKNIGLVRFEVENDKCIIGILVDEKFRGKGYASLMLINSSSYYFNRFSTPIYAHIKESNTSSIRCFEKAGYTYFNKIEFNGLNTFVYKLEKI